jgi:osmoprotectant transport system ATP-binding protein
MIELSNVTKSYNGIKAVNNISLQIDSGELCVLIGPSGCGKSTTLKMINRMIEPTDGAIRVKNKMVNEFRPELLRRSIGYVIQSIGLFPHMTVEENIATVPKLLGWENSRIKKQTSEMIELVELPHDYLKKYPSQLSGGEAQRIGVARALAAEPDILLMDEPFGALDPITRENLQKALLKIQKKLKKTVVFVTHDIDEAVRLASKIVIMRDGQIVQQGTPEEILNSPADRFVSKFVGSDRALKSLTRIYAEDFVRPVKSVKLSDRAEDAMKVMGEEVFLWVTDENGKYHGWIDKQDVSGGELVSDIMNETDGSCAVSVDTSLKDVLAKLVMNGIVVVPVVKDEKLIGEITIKDILESSNG